MKFQFSSKSSLSERDRAESEPFNLASCYLWYSKKGRLTAQDSHLPRICRGRHFLEDLSATMVGAVQIEEKNHAIEIFF